MDNLSIATKYNVWKLFHSSSVIKFWGPHDFGDPGSPISYEYGDPIINLGTPNNAHALSEMANVSDSCSDGRFSYQDCEVSE